MARIIWLASYPKSGNTWMRALLANYILDRDNPISINDLRGFTLSDTRPRFFDGLTDKPLTELTIEEVRALRPEAQRRLADARDHDHFVKTHSQLADYGGVPLINPAVTAGAIYILRDPRDMILSYAAHFGISVDEAIGQIALDDNITTAGDFEMSTILGRWDRHVESWTNQSTIPVCTVRYEDLHRDTPATFSAILKTLGISVSADRLAKAVRNSAFETLSREESRDGFIERPPHMERFFRSGKPGGGASELTASQRTRIEADHAPVMKRFGYLS